MILLRPEYKIAFVRGLHRLGEVTEAIKDATGSARGAGSWIIVPLPPEDVQGVNAVSCLPFDPPKGDDEGEGARKIGYKL